MISWTIGWIWLISPSRIFWFDQLPLDGLNVSQIEFSYQEWTHSLEEKEHSFFNIWINFNVFSFSKIQIRTDPPLKNVTLSFVKSLSYNKYFQWVRRFPLQWLQSFHSLSLRLVCSMNLYSRPDVLFTGLHLLQMKSSSQNHTREVSGKICSSTVTWIWLFSPSRIFRLNQMFFYNIDLFQVESLEEIQHVQWVRTFVFKKFGECYCFPFLEHPDRPICLLAVLTSRR